MLYLGDWWLDGRSYNVWKRTSTTPTALVRSCELVRRGISVCYEYMKLANWFWTIFWQLNLGNHIRYDTRNCTIKELWPIAEKPSTHCENRHKLGALEQVPHSSDIVQCSSWWRNHQLMLRLSGAANCTQEFLVNSFTSFDCFLT